MAEIERETRERLDGSRFVRGLCAGCGRRRVAHNGVNALAAHLGLSAGHVCRVLRGERQSRRVTEAAKAGGVIAVAELEART
jgi:hypothetical protein